VGNILSIEIPPKGFIIRRFIETAIVHLRGIKIQDDKLTISNCVDFKLSLESIKDLVNSMKRTTPIFFTGNDRRYTISPIAVLLNIKKEGPPGPADIIEGFIKSLSNIPDEICITKDLLEEKSTLNIFKANYYEYGKAFLTKPRDNLVIIDKLPIFVQLIGMLGALISFVNIRRDGNKEIYYYFVPPEDLYDEMSIERYKLTHTVIKRYYDAPESLFIIKLATEMILRFKNEALDQILGDSISVMGGNRATITSIEPIATENMVSLLRSLIDEEDGRLWVIIALNRLMDVGVESLKEGERTNDNKLKNLGNIITNIAENLVIYMRTCSLDALYSVISTLNRLADHIKDPERRVQREFMMKIIGQINIDPSEWLRLLAKSLTSLTDKCINIKIF